MPHLHEAAEINQRVHQRLLKPDLSDHALRDMATLLSFARYRIERAVTEYDVELHNLRHNSSRVDKLLEDMRQVLHSLYAQPQAMSGADIRAAVVVAHENTSELLALLSANRD